MTATLRCHSFSLFSFHGVQYFWILKLLGLRAPKIWDYSRLSLIYTTMSKRQLTYFVENKVADGWSDPRFPTSLSLSVHTF